MKCRSSSNGNTCCDLQLDIKISIDFLNPSTFEMHKPKQG